MRTRVTLVLSLLAVAAAASPAAGQRPPSGAPAPAIKSISERTAGLARLDGFIPMYWDAAAGRLLLEIGRFDEELLYVVSLPAGLGSNPVGLDRGQLGGTHVVRFHRVGPRVLMVESNYRFRALSDDPAERQAVADSFARSVLWGFSVEAETDGRVVVDATDLFVRDAHGVGPRLRRANQGAYRLDPNRSAIHLPRTKAFPKNTEVEAIVTLVTDGEPGPLVSQVTPTAVAVTVRQHHSFVELPDLSTHRYRPRVADPRVGVIDMMFHDYASPVTEPIEKHWVIRHHLEKRDPSAPVSEAVEPIVYYVDNGTPEPIRSALLEGARWWAAAFEAAGFRNAFRVEVLPADADPMDLRYNMIHWVHRSTRGWSYGASVVDPRTGQILKGNVSLGSLRVRQDVMLGTGLAGGSRVAGGDDPPGQLQCEAAAIPGGEYLAQASPEADIESMALARIRQLSAHEVGHTLGFAHNFAASTYGRASVMDYPVPLTRIVNGAIDLSDAYGVGVGPFDVFAARYAYSQFPDGADEAAELRRIVEEGVAAGMLYVSDADARPAGAAHPLAHLWDNGADPVAQLAHELEVRRIAMDRFGLHSIRDGASLSFLRADVPAAVPAPPLPGAGHGEVGRRRPLHLCGAPRPVDAAGDAARRRAGRAARGAGRRAAHAVARGPGDSGAHPGAAPAAQRRVRRVQHRAVPPPYRLDVRCGGRGLRRCRSHHLAAAQPAACRTTRRAARARRGRAWLPRGARRAARGRPPGAVNRPHARGRRAAGRAGPLREAADGPGVRRVGKCRCPRDGDSGADTPRRGAGARRARRWRGRRMARAQGCPRGRHRAVPSPARGHGHPPEAAAGAAGRSHRVRTRGTEPAPYCVGRRSCRKVSVLMSRNIGVRGGSRSGFRNSWSKW